MVLGFIIGDGLKALPHSLDVISHELILKSTFVSSLGFISGPLKKRLFSSHLTQPELKKISAYDCGHSEPLQ